MKFDNATVDILNFLAEKVYAEREIEHIEKTKYISENINKLEAKKKLITNNLQNILQYPDLLETQNDELQKVKSEIHTLQKQLNNNAPSL